MLDDSGDPAFKDEYGLREAYDEMDGIAVHGDHMLISGPPLRSQGRSGRCYLRSFKGSIQHPALPAGTRRSEKEQGARAISGGP